MIWWRSPRGHIISWIFDSRDKKSSKNHFHFLQKKSVPKGSPYVENLVQLIRVLQHRDSEHQITINSLGEKLRESERKRVEDDAKYGEVAVFLEQLKSYRIKLEKVNLSYVCWWTECYKFLAFYKKMLPFIIPRFLKIALWTEKSNSKNSHIRPL